MSARDYRREEKSTTTILKQWCAVLVNQCNDIDGTH